MTKIELHGQLLDELKEVYARKNKRYGDSVKKTFDEYGAVAFCLRLDDKLSRAKQLLLHPIEVNEVDSYESAYNHETVIDTLMDLANYAVIAAMEIRLKREAEIEGTVKSVV